MVKECENIRVSCECSSKGNLSRKGLHNQVVKMTCSMDTSQTLSLDMPVIAQWTHEERGNDGRDQGYEWAQQHGFLLTEQTQIQLLNNAQLSATETNTEPLIWRHSLGVTRQLLGSRLVTLDHFHHGRACVLCLV